MPEPYEICLLSLPCVFLVLAIISIYIASTLTDMACRFKAQESISASIYSKRQEQINSIYREIDNLTNRVEVLEEITKAPAEQELEDGALEKKLINQYSCVIEGGREDWIVTIWEHLSRVSTKTIRTPSRLF